MATQVEAAVAWARKQIGSSAYKGRCQAFVADAYHLGAGMPRRSAATAKAARNLWRKSMSRSGIPVGAAVYFDSPDSPAAGHVGLHVGNDLVIHAFGRVKQMTISSIIASGYAWQGWGWNGGVQPTGAASGGAAVSSGAVAATEAAQQAVEVIHIPQTEKVYTKYEADVYTKQPDLYRITWQSMETGRIRDITDRCEVPEMTDDADSLCLELDVTVRQGGADYYMKPLILVPGDFVAVTNTASGEVVFLGQVQTVDGSYHSGLRCRCLDGGRILTANQVIIQYSNIPAKEALSQLASRVGIEGIVCPELISSVYGIYRDSAAAIAQKILDTIRGENGVRYFLRMAGTTLTVRSFAAEPIDLWYRQASNLDSFDVFNEAAEPSLGWSIEELRNRVTVWSGDDSGTAIQAELEDKDSIARYGKRETVAQYSEGSGTAQDRAKHLLWEKNRVTETFQIETYGSDRAVAGAMVHVELAEVQGYFWITKARHVYGTPHRMELTLVRAEYSPEETEG